MRNFNFLFRDFGQSENNLSRYCLLLATYMPTICLLQLFRKALVLCMLLMIIGVGNAWGETVSITQSDVTANGNSKQSYATTYNIEGWTGKYMVAKLNSPLTYSLQIGYNTDPTKGAYNSHITTPVTTGGATSVTIQTKMHNTSHTASGRKFFLGKTDDLGAVNSYNSETMYAWGATDEQDGAITISISGSPTQFHIYTDGTAYIASITVTYSTAGKTDRTLTLSYSSTSLQVCGENSSNPTKTGNTPEPGTETWSSSNTSVATVSNTGVVTPVSAGSATITWNVAATTNYNAGSATANFTVSAAAARTVTWHVEGETSTTSVTPGNQATPPADPESSCDGTFVGWVATGDVVIDETPADADITGPSTTIYTSSNKPTITCDGNVDFYAVFKKRMED